MNMQRFLFLTVFVLFSSSAWGGNCNPQQKILDLYEKFGTECKSTSYSAADWLESQKDCAIKLIASTLSKQNCLPIPRPDEDVNPYFFEFKDRTDQRYSVNIKADTILNNAPITIAVMYSNKAYKRGTIVSGTSTRETITYTPQKYRKTDSTTRKSEYQILGKLNLLYTYEEYVSGGQSYTKSQPYLPNNSQPITDFIAKVKNLDLSNNTANRYIVILSLCPDTTNICNRTEYNYILNSTDKAMIWQKL